MNERETHPHTEYANPDTPEDVLPLSSLQAEEQPELKAPQPEDDRYRASRMDDYFSKAGGMLRFIGSSIAKAGLNNWLMVIFTGVLTWVSVEQFYLAKRNSDSSEKQLGDMITAANRIEDAADSFSASSSHINQGISDAVVRLQTQADRMEKARLSSENQSTQSLKATIDNFHQDQRAWLKADPAIGIPQMEPYTINIPIKNTGKTPARKIYVYFNGNVFPDSDKVWKYTFFGRPQPMGPISPGGGDAFFFKGKGFRFTREALAKYGTYAIYGAITYEDVYAKQHWLTYCFYLHDDQDNYVYCNEHNDLGDGPLPPTALE